MRHLNAAKENMVSVSMSILIDGGQATRSRTVLRLLRLAFCGDTKRPVIAERKR
jgi:hypothetical protein